MIEKVFRYFKFYRIKYTFGSNHGFSKNIQDLIKTISNHEFDNKMMEWILPIDSLPQFTQKCKELDIPFSITDFTKPKSKIIKVEKMVNRYAVSFDYDENLVEMIKTIDKRYWDKEQKRWLLPMHSLPKFTEDSKNLGFSIDNQVDNIENIIKTEDKCKAYIKYDGNKFHLSFTTFVNKIEEFKKIDNSVIYHKENQTFTFSIDKLQEILNSLFNDNIRWYPID
jgi:hypothetical protein